MSETELIQLPDAELRVLAAQLNADSLKLRLDLQRVRAEKARRKAVSVQASADGDGQTAHKAGRKAKA